jgi:hypothetical protein
MTLGEQWPVTRDELAYLYDNRTMDLIKGTLTADTMKEKME